MKAKRDCIEDDDDESYLFTRKPRLHLFSGPKREALVTIFSSDMQRFVGGDAGRRTLSLAGGRRQ
jgi:hypothetical protein